MKVKYNPPPTEKPTPLLKVGKEYVVLEIYFGEGRTVYRLLAEEEVSDAPALHAASLFDIVNGTLPTSWVASMGRARGFYLNLGPRKWVVPGFWDSYFDHEPDAMELFEEERQRIFAEEQ